MPVSAVTSREAVLQAVAEYDQIGGDAFRDQYGFDPARSFFLIHAGRRYDSKAIVGVAHKFQHPHLGALKASEFSGGEKTVARVLQRLGFHVENVDRSTQKPPAAGDLIAILRRICELQRQYSSENTAEMKERGHLVRRALKAELLAMASDLRAGLGPFGDEFDVDASDGIGRKTEAPWIRFFATSMSPNPREGFYVVLHFAADGTAVFITIGCGATKWENGEFRPFSDEDLFQKTEWARGVIARRFGSTEPFVDKIELGAKAPLPRSFEKATAVARRQAVDALQEKEVRDLLIAAASRLRAIYEAQRVGADLTPAEVDLVEIEKIARPARQSTPRRGQGFRLSAAERAAIELRAMNVAREWLEAEGYVVTDVSRTSSFDFDAVRDGIQLKVEVKGTTCDDAESILMTRSEVELHRSGKGQTALITVARIVLQREEGAVSASGGHLTPHVGWDIDLWEMTPLAFQLRRARGG